MLNNLKIFSKQYGPILGLKVYIGMKFNQSGKLHLPDTKHPIHFKPKTIDEYTIIEIFGLACYAIDFNFNPKLIVDGGANIGLGAVYFANRYPNARIIAIEPDKANFNQLIQNTSYYKNIKPVQSAVWKKSSTIVLEDNGFTSRGYMVRETADDPNGLLAKGIHDFVPAPAIIDILKLDIEGSEKAIFESGHEHWIPRTRAIIIELHDNMVEGCSKAVYETIAKYNFTSFEKEENVIFLNQDLA